jgi:hypothetical protein
METNISAEAVANADQFYTMVKSVNIFDKQEVKGVIDSLLSRTPEEDCFVGTYYRTNANIESILEFQHPKHFQAVAMLARGIFELAVDMRLLEVIPNSTIKMNAFIEVEKLRSARQAVAFKNGNPDDDVDITSHAGYIANNGHRVDSIRQSLWPNVHHVYHWSGLGMKGRVQLLKAPFEQLYEVEYPRLSWYVHPGLTGITNLKAEAFTYLCSHAFTFAANAYIEVLRVVIRKFKLSKVNEKIDEKLRAAKLFPFTNSPEHVDALTRTFQ